MKNQSIGKNAVFNVIKQICSIIFPLITYPYISRILGPDKLGKYSFADSIIQYFIILAGLGVPTYAVRECSMLRNDKTELNRFASEIFSINLLALLISYLLLFAVVCFVPRIRENRLLVAIMSIEVFASVVGRDWVNTVFEDFFYIAIRYILIQGLAIILMFVLVRKESDYVIYASISATAYSTGFFVNVLYTRKYVRFGISRPRNLRKHLKPILLLFCSTIAINIYIHSDITVLGLLAGDSETGIYTVVSKVYIVIKALLNAIITVTIPRLAKFLGEDDHAHYNELLATLRKYLYTLVVPAVVGTVCLGKDMLRIIGGRQ